MKKLFVFLFFIIGQGPMIHASTENPFHEGTVEVKLTEEERVELKAYAENTKSILDKALHKAKGKLALETLHIYREAIYRTIPLSFEKKKHSELLIRFILNQALDLVDGTPHASGEVREDGVLKNTSNKALTSAIYKNSIDLALSYYSKDMKAISEGTFKNTPYNKMASQRLQLAKKWAGGVLEQSLKLKFLKRVLEHWLLTVSQRANLRRKEVAHLIVDVQDSLEEVKGYRTIDERIRFLNGVIKWVSEQTKERKWKFQAETKHNCYGHIKGAFTNEKEDILNCYNNDLSKWTENWYATEKDFGCSERFVEGVIYNKGLLACIKRNHLTSSKKVGVYWTYWTDEKKIRCIEGFIEGIINSDGDLECLKQSNLKSEDVDYYWTRKKKSGCIKGFIEGVINSDGDLECWKRSSLKSHKSSYNAEPQFGCAEGFVKGITNKNGKLQCINLTKIWEFQTYKKDGCYGHIKGAFTNEKEDTLNCYNNDLSKWTKNKNKYKTEPQFGCAKEFAEGVTNKSGKLKCWKRSYLKSQKSYKTEPQFGCAEEFIEGIVNKDGDLKCWKRSYLKSQKSYKSEPQFGCAERFVKGITNENGKLQCINLTKIWEFQAQKKDSCYGHIKGAFTNEKEDILNCYNNDLSKWPQYWYSYTTETQFGCVKGFKESAAIDRDGKLKCIKQGQTQLLSCHLTKNGDYLPTRTDGTKIGDKSGYGYSSIKNCERNIQQAKNGLICSWNAYTNLVYRISNASPIIGHDKFKGGYGTSDRCNEAISGSSRKVVCLWNGFEDRGYLPYRIHDGKVLTPSQNRSEGRGTSGYNTQANCNRGIESSSGGPMICTWSGNRSDGYQLMNIQTRSVIASFGSESGAWENCLKRLK